VDAGVRLNSGEKLPGHFHAYAVIRVNTHFSAGEPTGSYVNVSITANWIGSCNVSTLATLASLPLNFPFAQQPRPATSVLCLLVGGKQRIGMRGLAAPGSISLPGLRAAECYSAAASLAGIAN
jgi:hypothetical protein